MNPRETEPDSDSTAPPEEFRPPARGRPVPAARSAPTRTADLGNSHPPRPPSSRPPTDVAASALPGAATTRAAAFDSFATTADGVYAIGDVSGPPICTHSARDDADLLYRHLAKDQEISTDGRVIPWAVFTDPQIGHVGLTEQEAHEQGYEVGISREAFAAQGKPKALGETEGFVKLVTNAETDELLGAHVIGEQSAEIIHELVVAIRLGATATDIADTIHIHPTLLETINSAVGGVHRPS